MILTVVGGGGMRTPLLISGLISRRAAVPVERVVLYDTDPEALRVIRILADAMLARAGDPFIVRTTTSREDAFAGAGTIITSIRVGGLAGRIIDEEVPLSAGVIGQETTGPGGWAMALRTIPVLTELITQARQTAPGAWIVNFTNPAGLTTQALSTAGVERVVGICDSPPALGRKIAAYLNVPEDELRLDYLGLNHLGWVRAVWTDHTDRLPEILASDEAIGAVYGRPLFAPAALRDLGLLPNEYLHYYYAHGEVVRRLRAAPNTRGRDVMEVAAKLRAAVLDAAARGEDPLVPYMAAIFARRSSYMAAETGRPRDLAMMGGHVEGGYARAALDLIEHMRVPGDRFLIVNTLNHGAITDLADDDVVEVPCRVDGEGPHPHPMGALPAAVRDLTVRVKAYERATVAAAHSGSWSEAVAALASHPLVPSIPVARRIADAYRRRHAPYLDYLR
jgi:6-phospho-beta-glucosidase